MKKPSDRPAVVLLHSSGSTPRQWQELVEALRFDFRVLGVEFHGHGLRPDWPHERRMTLEDDAALVEPLLQLTGGAHVVGHSYGGAVALKLACMRPHLVRSLVAYEPVLFRLLAEDGAHPEYMHDVMRAVHAMRERLREGHAAQSARVFVEFWSGAGGWQAMSARAQQAVAIRMPSILRHFEALFSEPFARDQLAHLPVPMLFLAGSRTVPPARRIAQLLRVALPLALHDELPAMGHLGPITHAHTVNERIRQFIQPEHASFNLQSRRA
jgi:pimeloyl-ACP methyl ester carboxylesterase